MLFSNVTASIRYYIILYWLMPVSVFSPVYEHSSLLACRYFSFLLRSFPHCCYSDSGSFVVVVVVVVADGLMHPLDHSKEEL